MGKNQNLKENQVFTEKNQVSVSSFSKTKMVISNKFARKTDLIHKNRQKTDLVAKLMGNNQTLVEKKPDF